MNIIINDDLFDLSSLLEACLISIDNHMNSSAIWEIIALSHVLEGRVITRGE